MFFFHITGSLDLSYSHNNCSNHAANYLEINDIFDVNSSAHIWFLERESSNLNVVIYPTTKRS